MSDTSVHPTPAPAFYFERQGVRQYVTTNSRSAQVLVGDGPGRFSPGDLLKTALTGCNAMLPDKRSADRLGEDSEQIIGISGEYLSDEDCFASFAIEFIQDLLKVDEEERAELLCRAEGTVERNCTTAHTLTNLASYTKAFVDEPVGQD